MAYAEKNILARLRHCPGVVRLHYSFQDKDNLYFVLDYCPYGDFYSIIKNFDNAMPYNLIRHYTSELVATLEHLHSLGIAHRDLKPENLLVGPDYHLKLTDFGTAKDSTSSSEADHHRRGTFVGTAQYVSPEVLKDEDAGCPVDLWALGCIIYQMFTGTPPFHAQTDYLIFEKIKSREIEFPEVIPDAARDLISQLLLEHPEERLGAGPPDSSRDYMALKEHPFFHSIEFSTLYSKAVPFGCLPEVQVDVSDDEQEIEELNRREFRVLLSGVIKKKSGLLCKSKAGLFYNKRILNVTSQPKIYYTDLDSVYKGEIPVSPQLVAELGSGKDFVINTPGRTYYFRELDNDPEQWVHCINQVIREHF